jgi:hypothetical protein
MSISAINNASRRETVIRFLFVVLFAAIYSVTELVLGALVILQFGFKLITCETNSKLGTFSKSINRYIFQLLQFVTFNQDEKPFPFSDWPSQDD